MALVLYSGLCGCHWPSSSFLPVWMHTGFKKIQNIVNNNSLDSNGLQVWIFSLVFLCCVKCTYCNLWAKNIFILDHSNHREFQNLHVFLFNAVVWRTRSSDSSTLFCLSAWYFVVSAKISWKIPMTASNQTSNVQSYPIHDTGSLFIAGIALVNLRTWRRPAACALLVSNLVRSACTQVCFTSEAPWMSWVTSRPCVTTAILQPLHCLKSSFQCPVTLHLSTGTVHFGGFCMSKNCDMLIATKAVQ